MDFKGRWYDPQRKRCEPLPVRDEYSRYVLELRRLAEARTETVRLCFERLFERHGLPATIRSDNGAPFAHTQALFGLSRLSHLPAPTSPAVNSMLRLDKAILLFVSPDGNPLA